MTKTGYLSTFMVLYSAPEFYTSSKVAGFYESAANEFKWDGDVAWTVTAAANG